MMIDSAILNQPLTHASRGGLAGDIAPIGKTDYGRGFAMGINPESVTPFVLNDPAPVLYVLRLRHTENLRVSVLSGRDRLTAVCACRDKEFAALPRGREILRKLSACDVILTPMANDRIRLALRRFFHHGLPDAGVFMALSGADTQVIAKSENACAALEILSERAISGEEIERARQAAIRQRERDRESLDEIAKRTIRQGQYWFEILEKERGGKA